MDEKLWDNYAECYHDYVISPFQAKVKNPLFADVSKLESKGIVADIGAGRGELLPFLCKNFSKVYAIDFSEKMLEIARQECKEDNVSFIQQDIRNLTDLGIKLDCAIASNSILHPSYIDVNQTLSEIFKSIKPKGTFIGIFPSMESILYYFMLVYEREFEKVQDEKHALARTTKIVERRKYNFITCTYDDYGEKQKFYYKFELRHRLRNAGFKKIRFKKVVYPWGSPSGDFQDFPNQPEMWDWYVIARK